MAVDPALQTATASVAFKLSIPDPPISQTLCSKPQHALRITYATGQQQWLVDHPDLRARLPAGATALQNAQIDPSRVVISEKGSFLSGTASVIQSSIPIIDEQGEFTNEVRIKRANGYQLRGSIVEAFRVCGNETLNTSNHLMWTVQAEGNRWVAGLSTLTVSDIYRALKVSIFEERQWRLNQTLTSAAGKGSTVLTSIASDDDTLLDHDSNYTRDPDITIAYIQIDDEILSYTAVDASGRITIHERGLFGTAIADHAVDTDGDEDSRPTIDEHVYIEGEISDLIFGVFGGFTRDGFRLPATWHADEDYRWLSSVSLDASNDSALTTRLTFSGEKKTTAKEWIESQLLAVTGGVLVPNVRGALSYRAFPAILRDASGFITLDERDVALDRVGSLVHSGNEPINPVTMQTEYNSVTDRYELTTVDNDLSISGEPKTYRLRGISSQIHTRAQRRAIVRRIRDARTYPDALISVPALAGTVQARVGDLIRVRLDTVRDNSTDPGSDNTLDRAMLVIGKSYSWQSGEPTYTCWGTDGRVLETESGGDTTPPDSVFTEGAQPLADVLPIEADGTIRGAHTIPVDEYYHLSPLIFHPTLRVSFSDTGTVFGMRVKGGVENRSPEPFVCTGASSHAGGTGATATADATAGERGFIGGVSAGGGATLIKRYQEGDASSDGDDWSFLYYGVDSQTGGILGNTGAFSLPEFALVIQDGEIRGLPRDLSGSGGGGSKAIYRDTRPIPPRSPPGGPTYQLQSRGRDGGRGGLGSYLICEEYVEVGEGGWISDGGDPEPLDNTQTLSRVLAHQGAPGAPGALVVWVYGADAPLPAFDASKFSARYGSLENYGDNLELTAHRVPAGSGTYRPAYGPATYSGSSHLTHARAFRLPAAETVTPRYSNQFDEFFADQPDGSSTVRISEAEPSDGNRGDIWITPNELANGGQSPFIQVFTDGVGYVPVDWTSTSHSAVFRSMIAIAERGGTTIHYGPTRPEVFTDGDEWHQSTTGLRYILYSGQDDVLTAPGRYESGANKFPSLSLFPDEQVIYGGVGDPVHPKFPAATGVTGGGNTDGGTVGSSPYPPLVGVSANPGGNGTSMGITINVAGNNEGATGIVVERDGVIITTLADTAGYYLDTGLSTGTTYVYTVYYTGPNGDGPALSDTQTTSGTLSVGGGTGSETETLEAPSGFYARVDSTTVVAAIWTPPVNRVAGDRYYLTATDLPDWFDDDVNKNNRYYTGLTAGSGATITFRLRVEAGTEVSPWVEDTVTLP